jgi:hypothetical protein
VAAVERQDCQTVGRRTGQHVRIRNPLIRHAGFRRGANVVAELTQVFDDRVTEVLVSVQASHGPSRFGVGADGGLRFRRNADARSPMRLPGRRRLNRDGAPGSGRQAGQAAATPHPPDGMARVTDAGLTALHIRRLVDPTRGSGHGKALSFLLPSLHLTALESPFAVANPWIDR